MCPHMEIPNYYPANLIHGSGEAWRIQRKLDTTFDLPIESSTSRWEGTHSKWDGESMGQE